MPDLPMQTRHVLGELLRLGNDHYAVRLAQDQQLVARGQGQRLAGFARDDDLVFAAQGHRGGHGNVSVGKVEIENYFTTGVAGCLDAGFKPLKNKELLVPEGGREVGLKSQLRGPFILTLI